MTIRTTHVGSLPRSAAVTDLVFAAKRGEAIDAAAFDRVVGEAVGDAVARQVAAGIDIVSDGEMAKISYATYIKDRISGFDGDSRAAPPPTSRRFRRSSSARPRAAAPLAIAARAAWVR